MRRMIGILLLGSTVCAPLCAAENGFTAPGGWVALPETDNGLVGYHTRQDKSLSLLVMVRPITTHGETTQQWADAETDLLRNKGASILSGPSDKRYGPADFVVLVSASNMGGVDIRMEQYFTKGASSQELIEVTAMGPEEFFQDERSRIESFLNSFQPKEGK